MRERLRKFLARHRRNRLVGKIGRNLGYLWQGFENQDYDLLTNGEQFVLRAVARVNPAARVFDVGAHRGDWARMAADVLPQGRIDSFEVVPSTYEKLRRGCAQLPNVTLHNLGLGETAGTVQFAVAEHRDELTSGVVGVHGELHKFEFTRVPCRVTTGDRFCAEQGIERIDFLKIDVEGMEPLVLRGFAGMLAAGRIGALQFEYGQVNLGARFFLGDFYELLAPYGMRIGKIYPNYVDFRDYHFTQDNLSGPNFLAVPAGNRELIRLLQG
ncbi:MAG TPA: FkbM family methyltransferase [Lacunisphaera sp.]